MFLFARIKEGQAAWGALVGPFKRRSVLLFVLLVLSALIETLSLGSVMPLLNTIVQDPNNAEQGRLMGWADGLSQEARLLVASGAVLGLFIFRAIITLAREYYAANFTNGLRRLWSTKIFENFLYGDLLEIIKEKQGHMINAMINEPIYAAKGIHAVIDGLVSLLVIIGVGCFLLWLNPWATVIAMTLIGAGVGVLWKLSAVYSESVGKRRVSYNQIINHLIAEAVTGIRQVKVFSAESRAWNEMDNYVRSLMNMMSRYALFSALPKATGELFVIAIIIGALILGHFVFKKDLALLIPEMGVFALAMMKLFSMGSLLLTKRMEIATYWPSVELVHKRAAQLPLEKDDDRISLAVLSDELAVREVSFAFPESPPVLSNISFSLQKGHKVGLVGKSGSGKSTLCDVLTKLITPTSGDVFIDNQSLSSINRRAWRRRIGYVSQESFLFHASVKDNIKVGLVNASDEDVYDAAQTAEADLFIRNLPDGYDTVVGGGGVGLSGGQKQRIALARALVRKPDVLVLDEATSGLDAETESRIFKALHENFDDTIIILVTHRLSTLKWTDKILYMDGGKVLESGSFEDLYSRNGAFHSLMDQGYGESR